MAWKVLDPKHTVEVRVPDEEGAPSFKLGLWPVRVSERIGARFRAEAEQRARGEEPDDPTRGLTTLESCVSYSMRDWSGFGDLTPEFPVEEIELPKPKGIFSDEKREPERVMRVKDWAIEILHANQLIIPLAELAIALNNAKPDAVFDGTWRNPRPPSKPEVTDGA